jgi:hypothetical protein
MAYSKMVFDSADLVRLIYSFGDPEHRKLTQQIGREIYPDTQTITDAYMDWKKHFDEEEQKMCCIHQYLEEVPRRILVKRLKEYKRCYCCQNHNRNKPTIHEGQLKVFTGVVTENHVTLCMCPCRHYSRLVIVHLFS